MQRGGRELESELGGLVSRKTQPLVSWGLHQRRTLRFLIGQDFSLEAMPNTMCSREVADEELDKCCCVAFVSETMKDDVMR